MCFSSSIASCETDEKSLQCILIVPSVPEQCVIDAYHFAVGCSGDVLRVASNERDAIMRRASANPLMLFQPTSWTVIAAADAQLEDDSALFQITDSCCEELTKMNGACLCDPLVSSVLEPVTGRTFLDRGKCATRFFFHLFPCSDAD